MTLLHVIKYSDAISHPHRMNGDLPAPVFESHIEFINGRHSIMWHNEYERKALLGEDVVRLDISIMWNDPSNVQICRDYLRQLLYNYEGDNELTACN